MPPIVILIANKADLTYTPGERVVSTAEGRQRAEEIEAQAFHEISVRESVEQVILKFPFPVLSIQSNSLFDIYDTLRLNLHPL